MMFIPKHFCGRLLLLVAAFGCLTSSSVHGGDVDLVFGTDPPYRLRVTLVTEAGPWMDHFQALQNRYHELLFDRLDSNGDGRLTDPEAKRMPPPLYRWTDSKTGGINETHLAFNFLVLDDDRDGFVGREELKAFYADYGAGPISRTPFDRPGQQEGRTTLLFLQLDQNRDGFLTADEIQNAPRLWRLDRIGDELLSLDDLRTRVANSDSGQFIAPAQPEELRPVANYPVRHELVKDNAPKPDGHLNFRVTQGEGGRFELVDAPENRSLNAEKNRVVIQGDGFQLQVILRPPTLRVLEQVRRVLRREVASLPGEKEITDEVTFPAFLRDHAALIDADADGKLAEEELESYLETLLPVRMAADGERIAFRTSTTVTGLFAYLDQDHDGQLSKQELFRLSQAFSELDKNGDEKLSQAEIPMIVRVLMEREVAPPPYLFAEQRNEGPPWFYRLDRNQDGTLTPAEFLGEPALFEQLDRDGNQILSLEEALAAEEKYRRPSPSQEN